MPPRVDASFTVGVQVIRGFPRTERMYHGQPFSRPLQQFNMLAPSCIFACGRSASRMLNRSSSSFSSSSISFLCGFRSLFIILFSGILVTPFFSLLIFFIVVVTVVITTALVCAIAIHSLPGLPSFFCVFLPA